MSCFVIWVFQINLPPWQFWLVSDADLGTRARPNLSSSKVKSSAIEGLEDLQELRPASIDFC